LKCKKVFASVPNALFNSSEFTQPQQVETSTVSPIDPEIPGPNNSPQTQLIYAICGGAFGISAAALVLYFKFRKRASSNSSRRSQYTSNKTTASA
jgi:hypothetical protein